MAFYDYDWRVNHGKEYYSLRGPGVMATNGATPPGGRWCVVTSQQGSLPWLRITQQGSKHGRRYLPFSDLGDALTSGIAWAKRKGQRSLP